MRKRGMEEEAEAAGAPLRHHTRQGPRRPDMGHVTYGIEEGVQDRVPVNSYDGSYALLSRAAEMWQAPVTKGHLLLVGPVMRREA